MAFDDRKSKLPVRFPSSCKKIRLLNKSSHQFRIIVMAFHDFSDPSKPAFRLDRFCEVALEFGRCHGRQCGPDHHRGVAKNMAQRLCLKRIIIEIGGMFGRSAQ